MSLQLVRSSVTNLPLQLKEESSKFTDTARSSIWHFNWCSHHHPITSDHHKWFLQNLSSCIIIDPKFCPNFHLKFITDIICAKDTPSNFSSHVTLNKRHRQTPPSVTLSNFCPSLPFAHCSMKLRRMSNLQKKIRTLTLTKIMFSTKKTHSIFWFDNFS